MKSRSKLKKICEVSKGTKAIKSEWRKRWLKDKRELWGRKVRYERVDELREETQGCVLVPLHLLSVCGVEVKLRAGTWAMKERAKTALGENTHIHTLYTLMLFMHMPLSRIHTLSVKYNACFNGQKYLLITLHAATELHFHLNYDRIQIYLTCMHEINQHFKYTVCYSTQLNKTAGLNWSPCLSTSPSWFSFKYNTFI